MTVNELKKTWEAAERRHARHLAKGPANAAWVAKSEELAKDTDKAWEAYHNAVLEEIIKS